MPRCEHQEYASTRSGPAEYCDEPAVDGDEYCAEHAETEERGAAYWRDLARDLAMAAA